MDKTAVAAQKFALLIEQQLERIKRIKSVKEFINYFAVDKTLNFAFKSAGFKHLANCY